MFDRRLWKPRIGPRRAILPLHFSGVTLLHPFWLAASLPWVALVAYLVRRSAARPIAIPFLALWPSDAPASKVPLRRRRPLPPFVVLLLIAMLLAIAAAAGPARTGPAANVTVILDRGLTVSVGGRLPSLIDSVDHQLHADHVRLVVVPGSTTDADGRGWAAIARRAGPTAVDTGALMQQAVTAALARSDDAVIAITDATLAGDPRVFAVRPISSIRNVGIASFAVSNGPHPQAMVRLRNRSDARSATFTVTGGASPVTRTVALPASGNDGDFFIDLPGPLARTVTVTLSAEHTSPVNDRASVVRWSPGPLRWSATASVPVAVKRMVDVYTRLRPPSVDAATAVVGIDDGDRTGAGVWLVPNRSTQNAPTTLTVTPDPLTADVHTWPEPADDTATPPDGWRVLVTRGPIALLAAAPDARRVWVNARLDTWSTTADFVVFFAGAFDTIADGSAEWTADPPHALGDGWRSEAADPANAPVGDWPGVYIHGPRRVAVNAPPLPERAGSTAANALNTLSSAITTRSGIVPWLLTTVTIMVVAAVIMGRRRREHPTRLSA